MAYTTRREGCPLAEIETWIFDLDNTLYPASCRLFDQVQQRMNEFICDRLNLSPEAAAELRRSYFREHGTTLNGLMTSIGSTRMNSSPSCTRSIWLVCRLIRH